ncbi:GNAT family N-acetyltransferase [Streptomyces sp. NPDC004787]|uniref:GNAT family N-acetyltransferase n=1 Tax=Streptomyces sp. NPDC004787 TaxID=3154291 RepID=UPI0033BF8AB4
MDSDAPGRVLEGTGLTARPYNSDDYAAVVSAIESDWLPGQHPAEFQFPPQALKKLHDAEILVLCDVHGDVAGVVSIGVRPADGAGLIVQLHGRENPEVVTALLALARSHLAQRTLHAFTGPATATGIYGLPVEHRTVTARALTEAGFLPVSAQRYFLRDLNTFPAPQPQHPLADVTTITRPPGWMLRLTGTDGRHIATAIMRAPTSETAGMAVLWQLTVSPSHRRQGVATRLLQQCLHQAAQHGAHYFTADARDGETAAACLLTRAGFFPLDTLTVFRRCL